MAVEIDSQDTVPNSARAVRILPVTDSARVGMDAPVWVDSSILSHRDLNATDRNRLALRPK